MVTTNEAAESLFSILGSRAQKMSALAQTALARGADRALQKDYDGAIREFRRAIGLDSSPDAVAKALDLIATAQVQQGKTGDAIATYRSAISVAPANADLRLKLGNLFYSEGRYDDASQAYADARKLDPASQTAVLSLGQAAMATGRYDDAGNWFRQLVAKNPRDYSGYYALGQLAARQGRYDEAIPLFEKTLSLKNNFPSAHVDLGYAYVDSGRMDEAEQQLAILKDGSPDLATILNAYIAKSNKPKIANVYSLSGFAATAGPDTPVSLLNPTLAEPSSSAVFTMNFIFSKEMDAGSVLNVYNWSLERAPMSSPGGGYNWGRPAPATDMPVAPVPLTVVYDPATLTAAVSFRVNQNADGTGTIDPSHILFRFQGTDAYGNAMDPSADEYSGISLIA